MAGRTRGHATLIGGTFLAHPLAGPGQCLHQQRTQTLCPRHLLFSSPLGSLTFSDNFLMSSSQSQPLWRLSVYVMDGFIKGTIKESL